MKLDVFFSIHRQKWGLRCRYNDGIGAQVEILFHKDLMHIVAVWNRGRPTQNPMPMRIRHAA